MPEITPAFTSVLKIIDCGSNCPFWLFAPSAPNSWVSDEVAVFDDPVELVELELLALASSELVEEEAE